MNDENEPVYILCVGACDVYRVRGHLLPSRQIVYEGKWKSKIEAENELMTLQKQSGVSLKFKIRAVDDYGNEGTLTIQRTPGNVLKYWSFEKDKPKQEVLLQSEDKDQSYRGI